MCDVIYFSDGQKAEFITYLKFLFILKLINAYLYKL